MAQPTLSRVARALRSSVRPKTDPDTSDHDLLARFVRDGDDEAFRALVVRHGKTVLAACRQVLADPADVDDSFQATFLVLLKKARKVDASAPVGGWLFAVAHRVAVRCRSDARRRQCREAEAASRRGTIELPDLSWREAAAVLHDELNGLPDKYRLPLLLCGVQGLTRDEAAEQLGSTVGAVRGQLERGRSLLERRLTRRGIVLSVGLLAVLVGSSRAAGGPSFELIDLTLRSAGGNAPAAVAALAHGAFPMTAIWKQMVLSVILAFGLAGVGTWYGSAAANPQKAAVDKMEKPAAKVAAKEDRLKERTITGKVVGPAGRPVVADLLYCWIRGKTDSLGKTNADGTFKVTVPLKEPGAFLVAKAKGYGIDFMMPAANTPADVTFQLPKDQPIRGRLIDPQGKPVAGAAVQVRGVQAYEDGSAQPFLDAWKKRTHFRQPPLRESKGLHRVAGLLFHTTTNRDGRFELTGVGAERLVSLTISGAGRAETDVHVITRAGFDPKPYNAVTLSLKPKYGGEQLSWSYNPLLSAPSFTVAVEPEKPIRGRLTDARTGKPRVGVEVGLEQDDGLARHGLGATTDRDGRFVLHGAKKWPTYQLRTREDDVAGYLPCEVEAKDTVGYEPVVADIACPKGVIVTGTIRDKSTGRPVVGRVAAHILANNPHLKKYPSLGRYPSLERKHQIPTGAYRIVVIPGPVLLVGGGAGYGPRDRYKTAQPDPKYPQFFHTEFKALGYYGPGNSRALVDGNWCKVIEAKETDTVLTRDIELEPAARKAVGVVGPDGKPVTGVHATGISPLQWHYAEPVPDSTITILDLEPKQERLVVALHRRQKLVGATVVKEADGNPVVKLGPGGTAKGRVVDDNGKPLAGITVKLYLDRREVAEAYSGLNEERQAVTGTDGAFEFDTLLPGYAFRFLFSKGTKAVGPEFGKAPTHKVEKHGDTLKLGDFTVSPAGGGGS